MILLAAAVAPKVAWAESGDEDDSQPKLNHRYQTGLAVMPGIGYRVIVPYAEHKECGDSSREPGKRVCTSAAPFFIDVQASFGVSRRVDLLVDLRFGVGKDPATYQVGSRQFAVAPGVRVWLDQDVPLKFYTTVQGLYDSTDYAGHLPTNDFGLRNSNGLMYDLNRNVGFYFQFGETFGLRRWFRIELDAGIGFQARYP